MTKRTLFLLSAALCAAPVLGAEAEKAAPLAASPVSSASAPSEKANLKISYRMKLDSLESAGSFVTQSGTQSNNVEREDVPYELDSAAERKIAFNKHGAIINALPKLSAKGARATVEMQAELTEPLEPATTAKATALKTFQYQGTFTVELGRRIVLVEGPDRRLELVVEELMPQ
jgi:hypothetical protein